MPRTELLERLRTDFDKMMEIFDGLTAEDWTDLLVPHFYMGPLPAFFYPRLPADGLRRALLGRPPGDRPGARAVG